MIRRVLFKIKLTNANDSDLSLLPVSCTFRLVNISVKKNVTELSSGQGIQ